MRKQSKQLKMYPDRKAESMTGSFCQQTKCQTEYVRFNLIGNEEAEMY